MIMGLTYNTSGRNVLEALKHGDSNNVIYSMVTVSYTTVNSTISKLLRE